MPQPRTKPKTSQKTKKPVRAKAPVAPGKEPLKIKVAAAGPEAMALDEQGVICDLLITDVVMPKMRGGELAERLRSRRPDLKVLFMSGYPDGQDSIGSFRDARSGFLQKPFVIGDMGRKVREILDVPD